MIGKLFMSDNIRRFTANFDALKENYPGVPGGNLRRHLVMLATLINGIVASKKISMKKEISLPKQLSSNSWQFKLKVAGRWNDWLIFWGHPTPVFFWLPNSRFGNLIFEKLQLFQIILSTSRNKILKIKTKSVKIRSIRVIRVLSTQINNLFRTPL